MSSDDLSRPERNGGEPSTEVYAVHGADPEVQAYGMAKYSRSALSLRESLAEINDQKAEKFLNTFYFQYGHRSIADLAHIAFAIERLSILAATVLVDEPRWDGQERSTRYQDFQKSGYYVPDFGDDHAAHTLYCDAIDYLFAEYRAFSEAMFAYLRDRTPKPAEMKQEAYERTLRARAFDISRYLLPAGGQYFTRSDRQRAHAGKPGLALAFAYPRGGAAAGRVAQASRPRACLQRKRCEDPGAAGVHRARSAAGD